MKHKSFKKEIDEIGKLANNLSSITESFRFCSEEDDNDEKFDEDNYDEPVEDEEGQSYENEEFGDTNNEVNQIRKICLNGMSRLCDEPTDETYLKLKKIFQIVDKVEKNEDLKESTTYYAVNKMTRSVGGEFSMDKGQTKNSLIKEAVNGLAKKGLNFKNYKLVSKDKIIR